ncbi:hypothetical protein GBAR_LOCUS4377, partial [Geodia barretti]
MSDSESGQKRSRQRLKRSGRPGTRLQSAAALSDSESGQKRSGRPDCSQLLLCQTANQDKNVQDSDRNVQDVQELDCSQMLLCQTANQDRNVQDVQELSCCSVRQRIRTETFRTRTKMFRLSSWYKRYKC